MMCFVVFQAGCLKTGHVCAMNGESYDSECHAWADGVPVDYFGLCKAVGQLLSMWGSLRMCINLQNTVL